MLSNVTISDGNKPTPFAPSSQGRSPVSGLAYEVEPEQAANAAAFMQGIMGSSDYAAALGANYSALIAAK